MTQRTTERLPVIGPAPDFTLTSQDGARVVARRFSRQGGRRYFHLHLLHRHLSVADRQDGRGAGQARRRLRDEVAFVSITVDPERDTPAVLKEYAEAFGADPAGWASLQATIRGHP